MPTDLIDPALRLLVAALAGMAIGLNRDLHGKPTGVRTLGIVSLGAALITIGAVGYLERFTDLTAHPDALSRVMQGVIQGILTGIGFIGAGVILRDGTKGKIQGLTTAAVVWLTALLGVICALGEWGILAIAVILAMFILIFGGPLERRVHRMLNGEQAPPPDTGPSENG